MKERAAPPREGSSEFTRTNVLLCCPCGSNWGSNSNKSDCSPNHKDSRAALQARDLEQLDTLEGRPILVKRALPARLAQAFYVA